MTAAQTLAFTLGILSCYLEGDAKNADWDATLDYVQSSLEDVYGDDAPVLTDLIDNSPYGQLEATVEVAEDCPKANIYFINADAFELTDLLGVIWKFAA